MSNLKTVAEGEHWAAPGVNVLVPCAHIWQAVDPIPVEYVPNEQFKQAEAPVADAYVPIWQREQLDAPLALL